MAELADAGGPAGGAARGRRGLPAARPLETAPLFISASGGAEAGSACGRGGSGSGTPSTSVSGVVARNSDATALATSSDCAVTTIASHETSAAPVIVGEERSVSGDSGACLA